MKSVTTNTAHQAWDEQWQTEEGRADWLAPDPFVMETLPLLKKSGVKTVVDLGCGVGRHTLLLAREGFDVHAIDASPAAIDFVTSKAETEQLPITLYHQEMTTLPFANESIDYLLAWNVIYHGNLSVVMRCVSEILRVLKPGGFFQGTMLSKRNGEVATGRCIAHNTYLNDDRPEKRHPHFYCNGAELLALFNGFEPITIVDKEHRRKQSYHWQVLLEVIGTQHV
jgi:tellurite methyltransferase